MMIDEQERKKKLFQTAKKACLSKVDLSRKGSIDTHIRELVNVLNESPKYYTTSTCSGRISVISKPADNPAVKKGGDFFMNSHDPIEISALQDAIQKFTSGQDETNECLWLKFEPFIMHIQCIDQDAAERLLSIALETGCRNSGSTISKNQKILVAIRSTSSLEAPISAKESFKNLQCDYLDFLCQQCNQRMESNFVRLKKFHQQVLKMVDESATLQQ